MTTPLPGLITPSTGNLMVGKGRCFFKPIGGSKFYLGNVPELEITPKATTLDHFDSQEGTRFKDKVIITEKSGEVRVVMEEATYTNLSLLLIGTNDLTDPTQPIVNIFSENSITGEFWFYASNAQGPRWYVYLGQVEFKPSGGFSPISTEFAKMEITGEMEAADGVFGTAELQPVVGTVEPENFEVPKIITEDGTLAVTGIPVVGDVLTALKGVWIGAVSFAYQWKNAGVAIMGATSADYTLVMADAGDAITCVVTATNATGDTDATSATITVHV